MKVEVTSPADYMGDVLGDCLPRRGKIGGMNQRGEAQVIDAAGAALRNVRVLHATPLT